MEDIHNWSTDRIETLTVEAECEIARLRSLQASAIAELDRRQIAAGDGCRTLADWVASRVDVAPETANALVRLARSELGALCKRLESGDWSFDRTVAAHRWVDAGSTEDAVIDQAPGHDISGLRRRTSMTRRMTPSDERTAFMNRRLLIQRSLDLTHGTIWGSMSGTDLDIVEQRLDSTADTFPSLPDGTRPSRAQLRVDALVAICETSTSTQDAESPTTPNTTLAVFIDEGAAFTQGGTKVGDTTIDRLLCDAAVEYTALHPNGAATELRGHRTVTDRQRRRIHHRDRGCVVDGCNSRNRLQIHHKQPKASGGNHEDTNLATFCWFHHQIAIHRYGFTADPASPPGRIRLTQPRPAWPPQQE